MSADTGSLPTHETPRDAAVAWHVRLQSDAATGDDWLAFEDWLSAAPEHQAAYDEVEALWSILDEATPEPVAAGNVTPLMRRKPVTRRWAGVGIAASLALATAVGLGVWYTPGPPQTYDTAPGERRTVALADGSTITLNGGSHVSVRMDRRERHVEMADAEAVFDVAKDPDRPFIIEAGERQIRVVGTHFNVLRRDDETTVTVNRGVVEVRPGGAKGGPPLARLQKGQTLSHHTGPGVDTVRAADPAAAMAWTEGRLVFQGERLDAVAKTMNRYVRKPIVVDPRAAALPVTATLTIGPETQMVDALAAFLPVLFHDEGDRVRASLRN